MSEILSLEDFSNEVFLALKDIFVAQFSVDNNSITVSFPGGPSFVISVDKIK